MLKRWLILISIIALLVFVSFLGLRYLFVPRERHVSLEYIVNIWSKEGESPKDVTVYLPFPHYEGKPIEKVFEVIKHEHEEYLEEEPEGMTLKLIETKYGKMLKVFIPTLGEGWSGGADCVNPKYGLSSIEPISLPYPTTRYLLSPRFEVTTNKEGDKISHSWIYLDYEDATGIILRCKYSVVTQNRRPPIYFSGYTFTYDSPVYIGVEKSPRDSEGYLYDTHPIPVEINGKGWIKIPMYEVGDYPEEVK